VQTPLQGLNPQLLDTRTEANRSDLREYLRRQLASQLRDRPDADRVVEQILAKSEGVFLYVERFCDDVRQSHLSLDRSDQFPQGLGGIFAQWFQRQFPDLERFRKDVRPALRAILAAREPLPVEILQRVFNWPDEELRDFTRTLGSLFPVTKENGCEVIKPYHKSLADWLADKTKPGAYFVSVEDGHRMMAATRIAELISEIRYDESVDISKYWSRCLLYHCISSRDWSNLVTCVADGRVFQSVWPGAYDCFPLLSSYDAVPLNSDASRLLGYFRADFSRLGADALVPSVLESVSQDTRSNVAWSLADAFADRAREIQVRAFTYAPRFNQYSNTIRNYLRQHHPDQFLEFRDLIYSFVALSGIAPAFALEVHTGASDFEQRAKSFLDKHSAISSYLGYLADFACNEGWSGELESEAYGPDQAWKRLANVARGVRPRFE
ncbi:MAG: hypothetical protein JNM18_03890, partial [Planctomycetaceae bacterium]|nr:hypothetical protein [Planctomycetaceae bacterium]